MCKNYNNNLNSLLEHFCYFRLFVLVLTFPLIKRDCVTRFQTAQFGIIRKILILYNSPEWFTTLQIGVRKVTREILASPALTKCTFCSEKVEQAARALLSPTGVGGMSCSCHLPQAARTLNWLSTPPRLWGGRREYALDDRP